MKENYKQAPAAYWQAPLQKPVDGKGNMDSLSECG